MSANGTKQTYSMRSRMSAFGSKADSARRRTHGLILTGHAMTSAPLRIRWQAANKMGADATVPSGQQAPSLLKWGVALGHSEWRMATINVVASAFHVSPASNTAAVAVRAHTSLVIAASLTPSPRIAVPFSVARISPGGLKVLDALISMSLIRPSAWPCRDGGKCHPRRTCE